MLDQSRLARRMHGRAQARAVMGLVDLPDQDAIAAFLDEFRSELLPKEVAAEQQQHGKLIAELAGTTVDFGQYSGMTYEQINREDRPYLEWLRDRSVETADGIGAYLEATEPMELPDDLF